MRKETEFEQIDSQGYLHFCFEIPLHEIEIDKNDPANFLGQGGFGSVYRGRWRFQAVAIKEPPLMRVNQKDKEELLREASVMARLRCQHIVQLYGVSSQQLPYRLIMEYLPRGSLREVLDDEQTSLSWAQRGRIAQDIARGMVFLHSFDMLHRDLKSLNVLMDHFLRAKVGDFGMTKWRSLSSSSTKVDLIKGTPAWIAPEIWQKQPYTKKADIYSYGIVLWEIASRQLPYKNITEPLLLAFQICQGHREEMPKDIPAFFQRLIETCWSGQPNERPTFTEILADYANKLPEFTTFKKSSAFVEKGNIQQAPNLFEAQLRSALQKNEELNKVIEYLQAERKKLQAQNEKFQRTLTQQERQQATLGKTYRFFRPKLAQLFRNKLKVSNTLEINQTNSISALAVLSDGRVVAACQMAGRRGVAIEIWDVDKGCSLTTLPPEHGSFPINSLAVLPNDYVISGSNDKTVKVLDPNKNCCLATLKGHTSAVSSLAAFSDNRVASGSHDKSIKIWDVNNKRCLTTLTGHNSEVSALAMLSDGRLVSGSVDGVIKLWNVNEKRCLTTIKAYDDKIDAYNKIFALVALPDGRVVSAGYARCQAIKIWDIDNKRCLSTLKCGYVKGLINLSDNRVVSIKEGELLEVWNIDKGELQTTFQDRSIGIRPPIAVLPGDRIISAGRKPPSQSQSYWARMICWESLAHINLKELEEELPAQCKTM